MTERFTAQSPADEKKTEVVKTRRFERVSAERAKLLEKINLSRLGSRIARIANTVHSKWNAFKDKRSARVEVPTKADDVVEESPLAGIVEDSSSEEDHSETSSENTGRHKLVAGENEEYHFEYTEASAKHRLPGAHRKDRGAHRGDNFDESAELTVGYLFDPTNPNHIPLYSHAHDAKEYSVDDLLVMLDDPRRESESDADLHSLYKSRKALDEVRTSKLPKFHESVKKAERDFDEQKSLYNIMYGIDTENIEDASPLDQLTYARNEFARAAYDNRKGRLFFGRKKHTAQYNTARETYQNARESYYAELLDRYEDSMSQEELNQFVLTFAEKEQAAQTDTEVRYFASQGKRNRALRKLRNRLNTTTDDDIRVRSEAIDDATAGSQKAQGRDEIRQQIWDQNDMWHDDAHERTRKMGRITRALGGVAAVAVVGTAIYTFRHDGGSAWHQLASYFSDNGTPTKETTHPSLNGHASTSSMNHPSNAGGSSIADMRHPGDSGDTSNTTTMQHPVK